MGYYTSFDLRLKNASTGIEVSDNEILGEVAEIMENVSDYSFDNSADEISSCESIKWYDYQKDMLEVSKMYPIYIFELSGAGEEEEDLWKEYFFNGKSQHERGVITYAPFDESKLK